jgi:FtsP/CotA-like multicopper oxidase with cupredoxin domain
MNRRYFFQLSTIAATYLLAGCDSKQENDTKEQQSKINKQTSKVEEQQNNSKQMKQDEYVHFSQKLQFPEVINFNDTENAQLTAQKNDIFIYPQNKTEMFTFSGELPSPTIRIQKGDKFSLTLKNDLEKPTIIHWHGLIVPEDMDGHPKDVISNQETYEYSYDVNQSAGTFWYHTHPHGRTGKQIYHGLAGMYIVEDEQEKALNLPSNEFELPLLIQDKRFDQNKQLIYKEISRDNNGVNGDVVLVNATPFPYHNVSSRKYRLRIANASSVRTYNLAFEGLEKFTLIGTDGGLLEEPIELESVLLSVAERVDLIVDFKDKKIGDSVTLKSIGIEDAVTIGLNQNYPSLEASMDIMQFKVTQKSKSTLKIPQKLSSIEWLKENEAIKTRKITMQAGEDGSWTLDNKKFDIDRIDQKVKLNTTEIWEIQNTIHMLHPFHMHGVKFQVLSRDGKTPIPTDKGWKDTVLVRPNETVRLIVHFTMPGLFLYHCHILEHSDSGMMAQFLVEE